MGLSRDEVVVGYVGRIAAEKNVNYLAEALDIVARESVGARALWVGDGPARSTLERRTGSYAHFAGYRHGEDLADHYAACDIFAFTSLTETFGNVVLEAMSSGLPVVALRAGGVADNVQSGTTGILVDPSEPPARFAFRLLELINDRQERMRMARAAREYALGQSWDAIMAGLRDRYELVVSECRGQLTESLA
jgi:glycosyltransferase involved in cell wall biosynthesis